jgi:two-component system sensor histidine kinase/response regulator
MGNIILKMKDKDKTKDELLKELHDLQQENNSIKKLYEADMDTFRQAEKILAQERYLLDAIMNNLPDHIYFKDRESRFIRITKDHAQSFGLSDPSQAVGKSDSDFFTWEHARQAYEDEQTIIRTGQPLSREERLTWPDRPDTWSSTTKLPLHDKEGNIIGTFGISRDITKSKLAEEALRESEVHYSLLFNKALDGICLADEETGLIIDCNQAMTSLVGRERSELIGQPQKILHPPGNSDATFSPEFEQHLADEEGKSLETQIITSTGIIRDVEIKANHINLRGRKTLQGAFRDITKRKRAEDALAQERYLMSTLMDNLPDHIYFKDHESRIIRINKAMAKFLSLNDPDEAVGLTDFDFFTEEHAHQAYEDEQTIIKTGQLLRTEEKETHSDRSDTWVSTIKMPLRDKEGDIIGTFGISRDITEHRKAHEELEKEHILLLALINNMPDRIYAKDTQSRFIICNDALVKRMGRSGPEDIVGKTDFDLVSHDLAEQYFTNEQEIIKSGQPLINHEESMGNISGMIRWNLTTKVPLHDNQGKIIGIVGIGRDITERKLAEEEIKLKNELLQTINAEKDKFFSIIAHDLKGPLSAFLGATQILAEEIQNMSLEEIKEITLSMRESASHIYGLLENLLEWSRLKRGMMDFIPETFNAKQKITVSIEVLKESARKKEIRINYSLPEDLELKADSHMFETVIRNLVSNAIKFTPKYGEIYVSATATPENNIEIKISDTGIGMSKELIDKLFLLNEKTNRKGTEGEPSTGLGLLLCKEFIEKHNGKIWAESEEGKGSTFSFTIPDKV